ncbi:MAG: RecQ family ATP-dependent DNA helicase [Gemmatimonadales bacterium]|nr:RecQ family ATP-dependent DNA helicase [Gemmatimonadales bacterium]
MHPFAGGLDAARRILLERFDYPRFRTHQLKVLGPLLAGRDVLAVLPTGAGKSLCYQVPALLAAPRGLTLVVSPLISLMQDQVGALTRRGIHAAYLNSQLDPARRRAVLDAALAGRLTLLYCAPERLASLTRRIAEARTPVALLAVDEAHCITEWGHAFRPVYRALGVFRARLGRPPTIALTGSATPAARHDILAVLRMPDAHVVVTSFDRPNLTFAVRRVRDDRERFGLIRRAILTGTGATLVYTPTRRLTELVTRALRRTSVRAAPYHAGLTGSTRRQVLRAFLADRVTVIVATSAFGMGIDKPDMPVSRCGIMPILPVCSLLCQLPIGFGGNEVEKFCQPAPVLRSDRGPLGRLGTPTWGRTTSSPVSALSRRKWTGCSSNERRYA